MATPKVKHVVVDAIAFFKNVQLQEIAENIYTSHGVVNEIRDYATRQRLTVLPYDLKCREPPPEALLTVSDFARKTGDYSSLSAVDLRVLALAYQITKEQVGVEQLFLQPGKQATLSTSQKQLPKTTNVVGFVYPKTTRTITEDESSENVTEPLADKFNQLHTTDETSENTTVGDIELTLNQLETGNRTGDDKQNTECQTQHTDTQSSSGDNREQTTCSELRTSEQPDDIVESTRQDLDKDVDNVDEGICLKATEDYDKEDQLEVDDDDGNDHADEEEDDDVDDDDDDDEGWITPSNIADAHKDMGGADEEIADVQVGCMTTDFAMQNVLIQMGIPVLSVDGLRIRRAKSYVLRCYGCFKITSNMTKKFCPGCGNQTMTKVSVSVDDTTGCLHLHFSKYKKLNKRGLKYSLPMPKGGKHANNPILVADQPQPQNHLARKARGGTDVFDPDYSANSSPFAMKDVTSRSALLGVGRLSRGASHNRRNPNAARRTKGKKK